MTGQSLQTKVDLAFAFDPDRQRTILTRRRAGGLCHLSKPYAEGTHTTLQIVNPTAGLFDGDELHFNVTVGERAQVSLECPSATRFHTMGEAGSAQLHQHFSVSENAYLNFAPEWTIPQHNSEVAQFTSIHLAESASLAFVDLIAPGRVAHGESYSYRRYTTTLEIKRANALLIRERMVLEPALGGWPLSTPDWNTTYYGALWISAPKLNEEQFGILATDIESDLNSPSLRIGATLPDKDLAVVRLLSASPLPLRKALLAIRERLRPLLPQLSHKSRKL